MFFTWSTVRVLGLVLAGLGVAAPVQAASGDWVGDARAAARLVAAVEATGSGPRLDLAVEIRLAPGWHTYWRSPGDAGIPASFDWQEGVVAAEIAWPAPVRFAVGGLQTLGYEDGVVLPVSAALAHPGQPARLRLGLDYAVCADVCVPYRADLRLDVPAGLAVPGPDAGLIASARERVPGKPERLGVTLDTVTVASVSAGGQLAVRLRGALPPGPADLFVEGLDASAGPAVVERAGGGAVLRVPVATGPAAIAGRPLDLTLVAGGRAAQFRASPALALGEGRRVLPVLGLALLGGLILNLMPCVLPVLGLKLLGVARAAGLSREAARRGLLATSAGVVASFLALAGAVLALRLAGAEVGWGIQFQQPWFLAAMAVASALFAANLWGWIGLGLAAAEDTVAGIRSRRALADAFLSGAFATLLASSCSAPFVGTAIGFGLSGDAIDVVAVFAALGLGMAAPLLAGAAWPGFARHLPRPGAWMLRLRQVLGVAMLGTALWLLTVLDAVAGRTAALAVAAVLVAMLGVLWRRGHSGRAAWAAVAGLAALAVAGGTLPGGTASAREDAGPWRAFDAARIAGALGGGNVVVVDVSATWCLTCKLNDAAVLGQPPVRERLRAANVVAMRADWSRPDPAIGAYLQSFGRFGVPMDVVYGPGAPGGILLPELLSATAVTDALTRAAGPTPARGKEAS